jgi:hypothetical protein
MRMADSPFKNGCHKISARIGRLMILCSCITTWVYTRLYQSCRLPLQDRELEISVLIISKGSASTFPRPYGTDLSSNSLTLFYIPV